MSLLIDANVQVMKYTIEIELHIHRNSTYTYHPIAADLLFMVVPRFAWRCMMRQKLTQLLFLLECLLMIAIVILYMCNMLCVTI